ncbi:MAG: MATE family efflux transporter [Lachnospiraceae bacterium]|nr:MATE family efflux transporter [Lachnospiraceae bacterium]
MKDLTKGSPLKLILQFAFPVCMGNIFQLFYNLADTRIVGSYIGKNALAAVGSTNSLNSMIIGFLLGMTNGFAIIVSRYFGAKKYEDMKKAVAATFELGIIVSFLFTIISVVFLENILVLLNTPDNIVGMASDYFTIILIGMTASMLYNVCSGILRAIGDSVTPLCFLVGSTVCNVGLDLLFINVFRLGVKGAAYATVISQILSFVLCMVYMWIKYPILRIGRKDFIISGKLVKEMSATGFSMGFMLSLINIGSVALQTCINSFGENIIIAHTAARKITDVFMLPFTVFGTTMATYCGQNLGAGEYGRIRQGVKIVLFITWGWCILVIIASYTIAPYLVYMVTGNSDKEVLNTAELYLKVDTVPYFVCTLICILRNVMQGIGDSITPIISSAIELITKVAVAILLAPYMGYMAIILAEPVSWVLMVIPILWKLGRNPIFVKAKELSVNE